MKEEIEWKCARRPLEENKSDNKQQRSDNWIHHAYLVSNIKHLDPRKGLRTFMKILKLEHDYLKVENGYLYCIPTKDDNGREREPVEDDTFCWADVTYLSPSMAKIVNEFFGTNFESDEE